MAKRIRIIEGTWTCTSCGTQGILGRHKKCTACNNPRELTGQESEFEFGEVDPTTGKSLREGVTDEKALDLAAAGEDWFCAFCGASNRGDAPKCKHCSAERTQDAGQLPPASASAAQPAAPAPAGRSKWKTGCMIAGGLVASFFMCCGALGFWASRTHETTGEVVATEWRRVLHQERFSPVTREGWRDELGTTAPRMPTNGSGEVAGVQNIRSCTSRQRGTRQVADGTERVCSNKTRKVACGTEERCSRTKTNNGFVREECEDVTKYCNESYRDCEDKTRYRTEPVFAQSCTYDTYEWLPVKDHVASGRDDVPHWPEVPDAGAHDRLLREEKYGVTIEYKEDGTKKHTLAPKTETEFLAWKKGQRVAVTVDNLGDVQAAVAH